MQPLQQPNFGGRQSRVPEINDEDDAILLGVIPGLVLEVVIEYQALSVLPLPGVVADA
jgi:hypothetical protein